MSKLRAFVTTAADELDQLKSVCDAREIELRSEMKFLRRATEEGGLTLEVRCACNSRKCAVGDGGAAY